MKYKNNLKVVFLLKNNSFNDPVDRLRGRDIVENLALKGWNVQYFNEQSDIDILVALDLDFKTHYVISKYPCKKLILDIQDDFINKNAAAIKRTPIKRKNRFRKLWELLGRSDLGCGLVVVIYKLLSEFSSRILIKQADFIITSSYSLENVLKRFNSNILTIPDSLDRKIYHSVYNNNENNHRDGKTICWIGTPSNIRYLLLVNEELGQLQSTYNSITIKLITDPKIMIDPELKKIVESFKFSFKLIEWTEDTFVNEVNCCDIGIAPLPSGIAKSSNKILTYMACHLAVICSGSADYKKMYDEDNGALIYEDDYSKWYQHLENLINDRELAEQYSKTGSRMAHDYYGDNIVVHYEKVFESIIDA